MGNESGRDQTEFNMAVSYLGRLNNLFYLADNFSIELNSHQWFHTLNTLFRELSTEMKNNEIEEWEKEIKEINKLVAKANKDYIQKGKEGITEDLYMKLHKFELFLRKVCKDSGLQMKMQEDAAIALR